MEHANLEFYLIIGTDMNVDEHERKYHYKEKESHLIVASPSHKSQLSIL